MHDVARVSIDQNNRVNGVAFPPAPGHVITHVIVLLLQCSAGQSIKMMTDHLYGGPTKLMIVGDACSTASQATSQASYLWNLVQVRSGPACWKRR